MGEDQLAFTDPERFGSDDDEDDSGQIGVPEDTQEQIADRDALVDYGADEQPSRDAAPTVDADVFVSSLTFPYAEENEYSTTGNTNTQIDQCGRTQTERTGNFGVRLTLKGWVSLNQFQALATADQRGETLFVSTQMHSGDMVIDDLTATRKDELHLARFQGTEFVPIVFTLQLKSVGAE